MALYSELPTLTLMTKTFFQVTFHVFRFFPSRKFLILFHHLPLPFKTQVSGSLTSLSRADAPEPQLKLTSQQALLPPMNKKSRQAETPEELTVPRKSPGRGQGRWEAESRALSVLQRDSRKIDLDQWALGKIEGGRRRGWQEDEMVGLYHRLNGHEFD